MSNSNATESVTIIELSSGGTRLRRVVWDTKTKVIMEEDRPPFRVDVRLGEDVFETGAIAEASMRSLVGFLTQACTYARELAPDDKIMIIGTEAMREAANSAEFCERILKAVKLPVEILTGQREAELMLRGILTRVPRPHKAIVADLGAGSLELAIVEYGRLASTTSYPMGHLKTFMRMRHEGHRTDEDAESFVRHHYALQLSRVIKAHATETDGVDLIVCGGMAKQYQALATAWHKLEDGVLSTYCLRDMIERLASMRDNERVAVGVKAKRAASVVVGGHILLRIAAQANTHRLFVPGVGLTHGLVDELMHP